MTQDQENLFKKNINLVYQIARKYFHFKRRGIEPDDLVQEGRMALIRCCGGGFNEKKGKFSTYACMAIQRSIVRFIGQNLYPYYVPSDVGEALLNRPAIKSGVEMAKKLRTRNHKSIQEIVYYEDTENTYEDFWGADDNKLKNTDARIDLENELKKLPPRHKRILKELLKGRNMAEIAKDYGFSRQRIHQLKLEAVRKYRGLPKRTPPNTCGIKKSGVF